MKQSRNRKILSLIFCIIVCLSLLTSCKDKSPESNVTSGDSQTQDTDSESSGLVLFRDGEYTADIVYTVSSDTELNALRAELSSAIRKKTGKAPVMTKDSEVKAEKGKIEILFGKTNREESLRPAEFGANDAWYYVGVVGNKLVINGANSYMLKMAVQCFTDEILSGYEGGTFTVNSEQTKTYSLEDYCSTGWQLYSIPYYKGEKSSFAYQVYNSGTAITSAVDFSSENVSMAVVSDTTPGEFEAYITRLKNFGFAEESRETLEDNLYATLFNGSDRVYLYYSSGPKRVNVIVDNVSTSMKDFSYATLAKENEGAEFYLYGLNMTPYEQKPENINTGVVGYPNNGMLLIIKCADNSVIIVDGGNSSQMEGIAGESDIPMKKLDSFLHQITGKSESEKVTISCWVLTHAHADHSGGFYSFIRNYAGNYILERICTNIPGYSLLTSNEQSILNTLGKFVNQNWQECKEIKIHTGQSFQISDVKIQAIYTQEDYVDPDTAKTKLTSDSLNESSIILKVSTKDMSMMILGDTDSNTENIILNSFSAATLHTDIVQVAHHGFNPLARLYKAISAPYAIYPQSYGYMQRDEELADINKRTVTAQILKYAAQENVFYAGKYENTVGFTYRNGAIVTLKPCET